jgi:hypothetical protein
MDIKIFIETYKSDLSIRHKTYDEWIQWKNKFKEKTAQSWLSVKQSYFQVSKRHIDQNEFKEIHDLFPIHGIGLFQKEDESDLLYLISNSTSTLLDISTKENFEWALNYLYVMLDMMFHECLYETTEIELKDTLRSLSINIDKTKSLDPDNSRALVEQKIELIGK